MSTRRISRTKKNEPVVRAAVGPDPFTQVWLGKVPTCAQTEQRRKGRRDQLEFDAMDENEGRREKTHIARIIRVRPDSIGGGSVSRSTEVSHEPDSGPVSSDFLLGEEKEKRERVQLVASRRELEGVEGMEMTGDEEDRRKGTNVVSRQSHRDLEVTSSEASFVPRLKLPPRGEAREGRSQLLILRSRRTLISPSSSKSGKGDEGK